MDNSPIVNIPFTPSPPATIKDDLVHEAVVRLLLVGIGGHFVVHLLLLTKLKRELE